MLNMDSVYREYAEFVYKYLLSLCGESDTAEELTQETFYQAVRSCGRYNATCKVSTWLCQIAKHLWYRELEKRKKKGTRVLTDEMRGIHSETKTPDEEYILREDKIKLFKKVHILDDTAKEVVLLRITGAFSFKEIGEVFDKSENWARVTYFRARQKIMEGWDE